MGKNAQFHGWFLKICPILQNIHKQTLPNS